MVMAPKSILLLVATYWMFINLSCTNMNFAVVTNKKRRVLVLILLQDIRINIDIKVLFNIQYGFTNVILLYTVCYMVIVDAYCCYEV